MEDMAKDDNHVDIFSNNDDNNGDDNADADADKKEKNLDDEGVKNQDNNNHVVAVNKEDLVDMKDFRAVAIILIFLNLYLEAEHRAEEIEGLLSKGKI